MDCSVPAHGSRSSSVSGRDVASCIHPYTNLKKHLASGPLVISRGEGVFVYDEAGNCYLEGMAGLWCASLGFSEARLADAAAAAMRQLPAYHSFGGKATVPAIDLAATLLDLAPVPMSKVFFANSGSEANDTAVKLVWYYNNLLGRPEKKKIISRFRAYHGVTIATASLTGLPANHRDFDLPIAAVLHTECPHFWRYGLPGESEAAFTSRLADALEALILREGAETIAAFIAEPVMGAGGVILPPAGYFEAVQRLLKRHDILFIVDEVICGFGRTGRWWGSETFRLAPDIITCAKGLSSGYVPISAVLVAEPIWQAMLEQSERIGMFGHGFTYSGHPVTCAVALEAISIYKERDIIGQVGTVSPVLQEGLQALAEHPLVGNVRGVGLLGALELVADRATRQPFPPEAAVGAYLVKRAEANGLIVRAFLGDVIAVSPPLIITAGEIELLLTRLACALDETAAWARQFKRPNNHAEAT